jgi:hypothetical protein
VAPLVVGEHVDRLGDVEPAVVGGERPPPDGHLGHPVGLEVAQPVDDFDAEATAHSPMLAVTLRPVRSIAVGAAGLVAAGLAAAAVGQRRGGAGVGSGRPSP